MALLSTISARSTRTVAERRYLLSSSSLLASAILVAGTLIILQVASNWNNEGDEFAIAAMTASQLPTAYTGEPVDSTSPYDILVLPAPVPLYALKPQVDKVKAEQGVMDELPHALEQLPEGLQSPSIALQQNPLPIASNVASSIDLPSAEAERLGAAKPDTRSEPPLASNVAASTELPSAEAERLRTAKPDTLSEPQAKLLTPVSPKVDILSLSRLSASVPNVLPSATHEHEVISASAKVKTVAMESMLDIVVTAVEIEQPITTVSTAYVAAEMPAAPVPIKQAKTKTTKKTPPTATLYSDVAQQDKPRWKPMMLAPKERTPVPPPKKKANLPNYASTVWATLASHKPKSRQHGSTTVTFAIGRGGALGSLRISRSSGNAQLDKLALDTVRNAAPFPPPPGIKSDVASYTIRIHF
jgi:protein TonB